jgi:hypothetical protein
VNDLQRPQKAPQGLSRWEEVIFPSYRIIPRSERSQPVTPKWLEQLQAKDLTEQIRGEK